MNWIAAIVLFLGGVNVGVVLGVVLVSLLSAAKRGDEWHDAW